MFEAEVVTRPERPDVPISELSNAQVELLRFFAGQRGPTRVLFSTYTALRKQGLIRRDRASSPYRITRRGRRVLALLDQRKADHPATFEIARMNGSRQHERGTQP
jgi:hypothetical protein